MVLIVNKYRLVIFFGIKKLNMVLEKISYRQNEVFSALIL